MMITPDRLLAGLGAFQLNTVREATIGSALEQSVGAMGIILQKVSAEIDQAPGRLRRQIADAEGLLRDYASHSVADGARVRSILAETVDDDTITGLVKRDHDLTAELIKIEDSMETSTDPWAEALKTDILKTYFKWAHRD